MIWAGSPFAHRIEFSTGLPTGAISYQLLGNDGVALIDSEFTPLAGAISHLLVIGAVHNTCATPLFETRTLIYSYETETGLVSDRVVYRVQKPVPFAVSVDGVRAKLGIEDYELDESSIDLLGAYAEFVSLFTDGSLVVHETAGDQTTILCIHAIEAIAGLQALGPLQLKLAQRESSGTNEFHRFTKPDWDRIEASLAAHVDRARAAVDPAFDGLGGTVFTFGSATRPDAITGA